MALPNGRIAFIDCSARCSDLMPTIPPLTLGIVVLNGEYDDVIGTGS